MAAQFALLALQAYLGIVFQKRPKKFTFQDLLDSNKGDETRPIPYIRGRWKTKPQRIWLGDFSARAVERDSVWTDYIMFGLVGANLLDFITVSYTYYVGQAFALTWGPINRVSQVYVEDLLCAVPPIVDNAGGSLLLDFPTAFGGDQPPGQGGIYGICDILPGTYTQARNPYIDSLEGNVPGLHGVAALIVRGRSGGTNSGYFSAGVIELREWQVEVMAWPDVLGTGDARLPDDSHNRIHSLYEWATSADYGAQYPLEKIHLPSWRAAAAQCFTEGLGFSGEINTGGTVGEVFDQLKASVDAEVYEHPSDGLKIKLIRKDYSIPSLPVLSDANTNVIEEYTPGDYADSYNRVLLNFTERDNNYQPRTAVYEDPANFQIQRRVATKEVNYPGVATGELAQKLVTRDGRALSQPWPPLVANAGEAGRELWPGEVFKFDWDDPQLSKIFRVHARTPTVSYEGERAFRIQSTEDQYSIGLSTFGTPPATGATNPADIWATAPPSATWDDTAVPPNGLQFTLSALLGGEVGSVIQGAIEFGAYAGGQYARMYVTEPGRVESLSPVYLSPDADNKAQFVWPAVIAGTYQFCVQTFSLTGTTNGVKVCATTSAASFSVSPSSSTSPSHSTSPSVSPSGSASPSSSESPSSSTSPSRSQSPSSSASPSESGSTSPSHSQSPSASLSPSSSISQSSSVSPSASTSPSSSASPSGLPDPSTIASIWEWWEPSREGLNDTDPIAQLTGQFAPGAGHNWTQAAAGAKPTYMANQLNGLGVADFSSAGTIDDLANVDPSALTGAHAFFVIKSDDDPPASSKIPWLFGTSGNKDLYPFTDSSIYCGAFSTSRRTVGNPAAALTSWRVFEVISVSGEYTVKLDGTQLFTSGTNTVAILNNCHFGSNNGANGWDGQMAGLYICSAKLSVGDRTAMIDYINNRFGLSST